mmetsp:Transcript_17490/g.44563  ORF Transcript_17490/g.44563 Transcript_17490/m.44563 type:complete len:237 (-) Transcript_17490:1086-1796(-)
MLSGLTVEDAAGHSARKADGQIDSEDDQHVAVHEVIDGGELGGRWLQVECQLGLGSRVHHQADRPGGVAQVGAAQQQMAVVEQDWLAAAAAAAVVLVKVVVLAQMQTGGELVELVVGRLGAQLALQAAERLEREAGSAGRRLAVLEVSLAVELRGLEKGDAARVAAGQQDQVGGDLLVAAHVEQVAHGHVSAGHLAAIPAPACLQPLVVAHVHAAIGAVAVHVFDGLAHAGHHQDE